MVEIFQIEVNLDIMRAEGVKCPAPHDLGASACCACFVAFFPRALTNPPNSSIIND